ncbi:MAG: hypothetical protein AB1324_07035 [Candidatus Micrarchaeota archaeon]
MRAALLALAFALLLLGGALGLKTTSECDSDPNLRESERMRCYYQAAITAAFLCEPNVECSAAESICSDIWVRFGAGIDADGPRNDFRKRSEIMMDSCYYDVAKITRYEGTCGFINQIDDAGTGLTGVSTTREMCFDEVHRLALLAPERYYQPGRDNICSLVSFVLPLIVFGAILRR